MSYISEVIAATEAKNPGQPEFMQTVREVLESLAPVIEANEELYRKNAILERLVEPDRQVMFRVPWVDDKGVPHVNRGYRVQFNKRNRALQRRFEIPSLRQPQHHEIFGLRANLQKQPYRTAYGRRQGRLGL